MITSIFFQFIIHLSTLIYLVQQTNLLTPNRLKKKKNFSFIKYILHFSISKSTPHRPDDDFAPSLLNSVVFIISCGMHVSTFIVNYQVIFPKFTKKKRLNLIFFHFIFRDTLSWSRFLKIRVSLDV